MHIYIEPVVSAVTWAFLQFLWQGTVVAAALAVALFLQRRSAPAVRYRTSCTALAILVMLPVVMALSYDATPATPAPTTVLVQPAAAIDEAVGDAVLAPALSTLPARAGTRPWRVGLFGVWVGGVCVMSCIHLLGWRRAQVLRRRATRPAHDTWQRVADRLSSRLGIRKAVPVLESFLTEVPATIGWLSPVILIPVGAMVGLNHEQIRSLLAHELAHIRRRDYLVNLLQVVAETLLFFHPAVWWVSRHIRIEREYCCDDIAVSVGSSRSVYARALLAMETFRIHRTAYVMRADGASLVDRVRRLTGGDHMKTRNERPRLGGALIAVALVVASVAAGNLFNPSSPAVAQTAAGTFQSMEAKFGSEGRWQLHREDGQQYLELRQGRNYDRWNMGTMMDAADFTGIRAGEDVEFTLEREAGTFYFRGDLKERGGRYDGFGDFGFVPSESYVKEMRDLRISGLHDDELFGFAALDVTTRYVRDLHTRGYKNVDADDLMAAAIHGVSIEFIDEIESLGYDDVDMDDLVAMRIHGVTPSYVREMRASGYDAPDVDALVEWRIHSISPDYVAGMRAAGFDDIDSDHIVEWRIHNITPEYIRDMRRVGMGEISSERLVEMRIHGVTPEYVEGLREAGVRDITPQRVIEMKIHGVSTEYVRALDELGYDHLDSRDLVQMKIHGVSPSFIRRVHRKGFDDASVDDLIRLRITGIRFD